MTAPTEQQHAHPTVAEAIFYYRVGLTTVEQYELDLFRPLSADKWHLRVLYLVLLDLEPADMADVDAERRDVRQDRAEASRRGWIVPRGRRTRLTTEGLKVWVEWKADITPHLRKPAFQKLWREVAGW
ncbi:hypothetical protein ABTZ99_09345 [Actinosynnema sp. NPDC002837]